MIMQNIIIEYDAETELFARFVFFPDGGGLLTGSRTNRVNTPFGSGYRSRGPIRLRLLYK